VLHAPLLLTPGSPWQVGSIIPVAEVEVEAGGDWVTCLRSQQDFNAGLPGPRVEFLNHPPSGEPCERKRAGPRLLKLDFGKSLLLRTPGPPPSDIGSTDGTWWLGD